MASVAPPDARRYPFDATAWARVTRARLAVDGPRALGGAALRLALAGISAWGWARDTPAPAPARTVLVVGHQRSGTTWLHRMLAAHPAATALPLHALALPADTWQRRLAGPCPGWLARAQDRRLAALDPIHRIRLHEPEEDEFALWPLLRSPICAWDRPWPPGQAPRIDEDDAALAFYAQVVARQVRRTGRRYVGKNPHFTHRMDALRQHLPGVRFVLCLRHPEQAIASRLSLIRAIWRLRVPGFTELAPHQVELVVQGSLRCYRATLAGADVVVRYPDLVRDPLGEVTRIHDALGLEPITPEIAQRMACASRTGAGVHRYGLAEFGVRPERIRADLADVYARWGFDATEG